MKNVLQAVFKISLWELLVIIAFGALKYILVTYGLNDKISQPFTWLCIGSGLLYLVALGIIGILQSKGISLESWQAEGHDSKGRRFVSAFVV